MKMKLLIIPLTLFLLVSFSLPEEVIVWKEGIVLQSSNFKGKNPNDGGVMSTTCDIDKKIITYDDSAIVNIEAIFLPSRSWQRKGKNEADLLMHEQKHFDIAELYSRKLRKLIKGSEFNNSDELSLELSHYHKKIMEELDHYQDKYDNKTDHSINGTEQRKWNKKVAKELAYLDFYKDTRIVVYFKRSITPDQTTVK